MRYERMKDVFQSCHTTNLSLGQLLLFQLLQTTPRSPPINYFTTTASLFHVPDQTAMRSPKRLALTLISLSALFPSANAFVDPSPACTAFFRTRPRLSSHTPQQYGDGLDQAAMMESDMLIVVNEKDEIVDDVVISKKVAHVFNSDQPRGVAHRAFSIFIFNEQNEMLLTRRADSKITFPGVWTNTCCSHPLYNMSPNEVDEVPAAYPSFPGVKHAAIRKIKHELGIDPAFVPHGDIQFVSRFHYWAADTKTYGPDAPWGEHEIDYVLFVQCPNEIIVTPNPDEVDEYRYVSIHGLKTMLDEPNLLWSPWFRGIMDHGGFDWWATLEQTMAGGNTNDNVVFFDPPSDHVARYNSPTHDRCTGVYSNAKM
jgi:isopentenyl-diphosphate Delta-isomerase